MKIKLLLCFLCSFANAAYAQINLTQGLVAYFPFNGNTLDASGNGNNAGNNGATLTTDQWGNPNSAYLFNGAGNYMTVASSPTLQMQSITLCARIKPNGFYAGPCFNNCIFDRGNGGVGAGSFSLIYTPSLNQNPGTYCNIPDPSHESYRINVNGSANASLACITPANAVPYITTSQWDCVIGIYDNASRVGSIYVNGIFRYSYTYLSGMGPVNNSPLRIGGTTYPGYPYSVNGVLDELRIYNRALNIQEIDSICNLSSPLPVLLSSFYGKQLGASDELNWSTGSEQNNAYFTLQHSTDGISFSTLARVESKATNGNSAIPLTYTYTNGAPAPGRHYYRLQQTDIDQNVNIHSQLVVMNRQGAGTTVSIYPNPVKNKLFIDLFETQAHLIDIRLIDMSGRMIEHLHTRSAPGLNSLQLNTGDLVAGIYAMQVYESDRLIETRKVSKEE